MLRPFADDRPTLIDEDVIGELKQRGQGTSERQKVDRVDNILGTDNSGGKSSTRTSSSTAMRDRFVERGVEDVGACNIAFRYALCVDVKGPQTIGYAYPMPGESLFQQGIEKDEMRDYVGDVLRDSANMDIIYPGFVEPAPSIVGEVDADIRLSENQSRAVDLMVYTDASTLRDSVIKSMYVNIDDFLYTEYDYGRPNYACTCSVEPGPLEIADMAGAKKEDILQS